MYIYLLIFLPKYKVFSYNNTCMKRGFVKVYSRKFNNFSYNRVLNKKNHTQSYTRTEVYIIS